MKTERLSGFGILFYHFISRIVVRRAFFQPKDMESLRNQEAFPGGGGVSFTQVRHKQPRKGARLIPL